MVAALNEGVPNDAAELAGNQDFHQVSQRQTRNPRPTHANCDTTTSRTNDLSTFIHPVPS